VTILVFLDGVLRTENKVPIFDGLSIYRALNENATVYIVCDDDKEADRWCKEHKVADVDGFISNNKVGDFDNKNFLKIQHVQSSGPVEFVVTSDVDLATTCLENGIKTLLFVHPVYLSAKFRPDGRSGRKSWDDLLSEFDHQINMRIGDKRK
jgi:hypothetical protein